MITGDSTRANSGTSSSARFSVVVPNPDAIYSIEVYRPRWNGESYELDLIGRFDVR